MNHEVDINGYITPQIDFLSFKFRSSDWINHTVNLMEKHAGVACELQMSEVVDQAILYSTKSIGENSMFWYARKTCQFWFKMLCLFIRVHGMICGWNLGVTLSLLVLLQSSCPADCYRHWPVHRTRCYSTLFPVIQESMHFIHFNQAIPYDLLD